MDYKTSRYLPDDVLLCVFQADTSRVPTLNANLTGDSDKLYVTTTSRFPGVPVEFSDV